MAIIVNLDAMLAKRKMSVTELSEKLGITMANVSILKNRKAKAIKFSTLEKICEILECQPGDILEYKKKNLDYLNGGECMSKIKYLLASTPILLGIVCLITFNMIGSRIEPDGRLVEPFFLIPIGLLLGFIGIVSILFVFILSMLKNKHN